MWIFEKAIYIQLFHWKKGIIMLTTSSSLVAPAVIVKMTNRVTSDDKVGPMTTPVSPITWWRHQMETFSALLALCGGNSLVTGEFPSQKPMTWSFGVFFDLRLNKRLGKPQRRRWFETPSRSLWRHQIIHTIFWLMKCQFCHHPCGLLHFSCK